MNTKLDLLVVETGTIIQTVDTVVENIHKFCQIKCGICMWERCPGWKYNDLVNR